MKSLSAERTLGNNIPVAMTKLVLGSWFLILFSNKRNWALGEIGDSRTEAGSIKCKS